ncbi:MAG: TrmH family RNA methyltransferase [Phycisphaerales bacterium JB037]
MPRADLNTILIDSIDDPRVEAYRNQRDAWLRAAHNPDRVAGGEDGGSADGLAGGLRGGLFMAEGILVVEQLARSGYRAHSVLLTPERRASHADLLGLFPVGTPIFVAEPSVMNGIVGFKIHRGMLAAGQRGTERSLGEATGRARLGVLMEDLANHDNVGGIFRSVGALAGEAGCVLLNERTCDPLYRKALRVSVGQVLRVPWARVGAGVGVEEAAGALRRDGWTVAALATDARGVTLGEFAGSLAGDARVMLAVGAEGPGLSEAARRSADACVRIPMDPAVDSLNVTVAASIALAAVRDRLGIG